MLYRTKIRIIIFLALITIVSIIGTVLTIVFRFPEPKLTPWGFPIYQSIIAWTILIDIILSCVGILIIKKLRKISLFLPILTFFILWWIDIGTAISHLIDLEIEWDVWIYEWPTLTDEYLIITNTFSSYFFGIYSWSIVIYYFGTVNFERYRRVIKSLILFYPFWLGICIHLCIIGESTYFNGWLTWQIIFGVWVALGSIYAIALVLLRLEYNFDQVKHQESRLVPTRKSKEIQIPRKLSTKIIDFFERFEAIFLILILLINGMFLGISSILGSISAISFIILFNFLLSSKKEYHISIKTQEEELLLNEFELLLRRARDSVNEGKKNYSKKLFDVAIEKWKEAISYYEELLKKAIEKERIKHNLKILIESIYNAYIENARVHTVKGKERYKKWNLQEAKDEWHSAIDNIQLAMELIKTKKVSKSYSDLKNSISSIQMNIKRLEIEKTYLDSDKDLKYAHNFQKKDLTGTIKLVNDIIFRYSQAKEKALKYNEFQDIVEKLQERIIEARAFQSDLQEKMDKLIGITPITAKAKIKVDDIISHEIPPIIKEEQAKKLVTIMREYEFIGGQIRFKVGVKNNTQYSLTNFKITFDIPKALKWILHEPDYERKGDSILIAKLGAKEKKAVSLYLEPINCMESPVNATVSFYNVKDKPRAIPMEPKMVSITCPIFFTETDANLARVKSLRRRLTHQDKRIFPIVDNTYSSSVFSSVISVLGKFDIKLIFKDFSEEDRLGEAWYFGITKVKKNQVITYVLLDGENRTLKVEVSGNDEEQITAFLAEMGDKIRQQLIQSNVIATEDKFYDLRVSILSNICPYCYSYISHELVQKYISGESIKCYNCDVDLQINK